MWSYCNNISPRRILIYLQAYPLRCKIEGNQFVLFVSLNCLQTSTNFRLSDYQHILEIVHGKGTP